MKNQKGFSLVELLVVVIIIAIIAAIAIPNLLASRRAANEASAASNLRTIHSAQVTRLANTGAYDTLANLATAQILDNSWATGVTKNTYVYAEMASPTASVYCVSANSPLTSDQRNYAINFNGVVQVTAAVNTASACTATTGVITGATVVLGS